MRLELRNLLVGAATYPWANRVWEPNRFTSTSATVVSSTPKPYIIVREMNSNFGEDWGGASNMMEVYIYTDIMTSFKDIDSYEQIIVSLLHRQMLHEPNGTVDYVMYQGDIGPDIEEPELNRIGRGMSFTVYPLGWLNGITYDPDPVSALRLFTNDNLGAQQKISINGNPTGGTWSMTFNGQTTTEEQTITLGGIVTGGTFTLTYNGQTTASIPYDATSAQVQSSLSSLPALGANISVQSISPRIWKVRFGGTFIGQSQSLLSGDPTLATSTGFKTLTVAKTRYGALPWNAYPGDVENSLAGLSNIGIGNVRVWGYQGGPYIIEFISALGGIDQPIITASPLFTGGNTPSITVSITRQSPYTDPLSWNPLDPKPAVYWRLVTGLTRPQDMENWGVWITGEFRAHIITPGAAARLTQIRQLVEAIQKTKQIRMSNGSTLFFERIDADTRTDPMRDGQVRLQARWAVMNDYAQSEVVRNIQLITNEIVQPTPISPPTPQPIYPITGITLIP